MQTHKANIIRDPKHLEFIRSLPCVKCAEMPSDAAHIRIGSDGGMGLKPSDSKTLPICRVHHNLQHAKGERTFYKDVDAAHKLAHGLYLLSGDAWNANMLIAQKRAELFE